ncbi:hisA/hisF family protein [bacterium]|nr:hisA/hisF family protein [bacterium]
MTSPSDPPAWYQAILPVIDLRGGQVVRGIAGNRDQYQPIQSRYAPDALPGSIAQAYASSFQFSDCYVADLGAICDRRLDVAAIESIAASGLRIWLDAGIESAARWQSFQRMLGDGIPYRWIVGLEVLESWEALSCLLQQIGPERLVFSLDMKEGKPLTAAAEFQLGPEQIAQRAIELGVRSMIVLDLASVGRGKGSGTETLLGRLYQRFPDVQLVAGGGVRGVDDLKLLKGQGAKRVLVASALHDGLVKPAVSD